MREDVCDRHQSLASAWLDRELERAEAEEWLDHLVRCAGCRDHYRRARALAGLVRAVAPPAGADDAARRPQAAGGGHTAPPRLDGPRAAELWAGVERAAARPRRRPTLGRVWRVAAALLVAGGLAFAGWQVGAGSERQAATAIIEVELGSRPEAMDDVRFLELVRQVMEADDRYRRAMYRVMDEVLATRPPSEGGGEASRDGEEERARGRV